MFGYTLRAQKDFSISSEKWWLVPSFRVYVSSGQHSLCRKQTNSFFLKFGQGNFVVEETQLSIVDNIGEIYCPGRGYSRQKWFCVHTWKGNDENYYKCLQCNVSLHVLNFFLKDQKQKKGCWSVMVHNVLSKILVVTTETKYCLFSEEFSPPTTINHTRTCTEKGKKFPFKA